MKKLLATTAIALVAMASTASAQSVLERVLGQIDNATNLAPVNGTFANIAENIGGSTAQTVYLNLAGDAAITEAEYDALVEEQIATDLAVDLATLGTENYRTTEPDAADYDLTTSAGRTNYDAEVALYQAYLDEVADAAVSGPATIATAYPVTDTVVVAGLEGINGSINNTIDGIGATTQEAIASADVSAIEYNMPTFDFGDMATTALGAVNTGEITLGVNSSVDNAKTSSTEAVSSVMEQLGGSADTGAIVLNIASNMTGINGSITNTMAELNGSMGNLSTTALGAVNTGEIISGVNAAVTGITGASAGQ